jgi:hypothetical protein
MTPPMSPETPPSRRTFLRHAGLSAAGLSAAGLSAAGALPLPALAEGAPGPLGAGPGAWGVAWDDEAAALLAQPPAQAWDTSWTARVTGQHKAMFDIPEIEGGVGVMRAGSWLRAYEEVLKVKRDAITQVIVLRHNAIPLVMTNAFWAAYPAGKEMKVRGGAEGEWATANPVLGGGGGGGGGRSAPVPLDALIAGGSIVLGCGVAFAMVTRLVARQDGLSTEAAAEKARGMILPGVIMQPSGIFAGTLAQHHGCCFVRAV